MTFLLIDYYLNDTEIHKKKKVKKRNRRICEISVVINFHTISFKAILVLFIQSKDIARPLFLMMQNIWLREI